VPSSRPRTIAARIAGAAFAASWFLPTVHVQPGSLFGDIDAGWKAFMLALSMVLKPDRLDWFWALSVAGVLANVPVVLAMPWLFRTGRAIPRGLAGSLVAAFLVNLCWIVVMSDTTLLVGYWLWIGSIGALAAVATFGHRRPRTS
jgi:hypothetical protein